MKKSCKKQSKKAAKKGYKPIKKSYLKKSFKTSTNKRNTSCNNDKSFSKVRNNKKFISKKKTVKTKKKNNIPFPKSYPNTPVLTDKRKMEKEFKKMRPKFYERIRNPFKKYFSKFEKKDKYVPLAMGEVYKSSRSSSGFEVDPNLHLEGFTITDKFPDGRERSMEQSFGPSYTSQQGPNSKYHAFRRNGNSLTDLTENEAERRTDIEINRLQNNTSHGYNENKNYNENRENKFDYNEHKYVHVDPFYENSEKRRIQLLHEGYLKGNNIDSDKIRDKHYNELISKRVEDRKAYTRGDFGDGLVGDIVSFFKGLKYDFLFNTRMKREIKRERKFNKLKNK